MIRFVHIRDPHNAGDMASVPSRWLDFGQEVETLNYSDPVPDDGAVTVYGGGTMMNWLNQGPRLPRGPKVLWGAGSSRHGETEPWPDPEGFDLIGTREWTPERERAGRWAPCVSCLSPLFDIDFEVKRERVRFVNASDGIRSRYPAIYRLDHLPTMDNSGSMEDIIAFLGSAETVVTNSYHGCWFAQLLGRKVVCVPYSSKFYNLRYPVAYSASGADWKEKAKTIDVFSDALHESRRACAIFHERVMELARR